MLVTKEIEDHSDALIKELHDSLLGIRLVEYNNQNKKRCIVG